jgi:hypothetical protein
MTDIKDCPDKGFCLNEDLIEDQCELIGQLRMDNGARGHIDLMVDEFDRIKSILYGIQEPEAKEIIQLCERAITNTMQRVTVIKQRNQAIERAEAAEKALAEHLASHLCLKKHSADERPERVRELETNPAEIRRRKANIITRLENELLDERTAHEATKAELAALKKREGEAPEGELEGFFDVALRYSRFQGRWTKNHPTWHLDLEYHQSQRVKLLVEPEDL